MEVDPADTVGQARLTYHSVSYDRVERLLEDPRWTARPNFHLMFMTSGCFRIGGEPDVATYWATWANSIDDIRQWKRGEFDAAFERLLALGVVKASHRAIFDDETIATKRPNIGFAPGVTLRWTLPLQDAVTLDARGKLEAEITSAMKQAAEALNLKLPL
jgi:hypothetical protein